MRLALAASRDVKAGTLDQHNKAAIEPKPRYIPPIFEAITAEFFKNSNNYPHTYTFSTLHLDPPSPNW